jgi:hypothetical protein
MSDERTGLQFTIAGPRQRSHFPATVSRDTWLFMQGIMSVS